MLLFSGRCLSEQEMMNYLQHVRDVWHAMVPHDTHQYLDECTVHELELLAPASSGSDESKSEICSIEARSSRP
jgi:hypothetical protein